MAIAIRLKRILGPVTNASPARLRRGPEQEVSRRMIGRCVRDFPHECQPAPQLVRGSNAMREWPTLTHLSRVRGI
jgi:hypothetical protein